MVWWWVAVGSAVGGASRYALALAVQQRAGLGFPWGTLLVNVTGSLLLGFLFHWAVSTQASPELRALLTTGFCGGYTTFSTFSLETIRMMEEGEYRRATLYVVVSVVVSLAATLAGIAAARELVIARADG